MYVLRKQRLAKERELYILHGKWGPKAYAYQIEIRKRWNKQHPEVGRAATQRYRDKLKALGFSSAGHEMLLYQVTQKEKRLKLKQARLAYVLKKRSNKAKRSKVTKAQRYDTKMWPRWPAHYEGERHRKAEVRMALQ